VIAQVVVRDAGMRVDDPRRPPGVVGVDLRGDQHGPVAEYARVVDRRDLADDPLVEQPPRAAKHLVLGDLRELGDAREGPRRQREAALEQVEESLVELVQGDRRAAPAAADLGYRRSHRAASFA